jgi:hypothetical protein
MNWRSAVKRSVPPVVLNRTLLAFPALYRMSFINFETNLPPEGVADLCAQLDLALGLDGDIIECGSSRCGGSIIMAERLRTQQVDKQIYACDSFQGFDPEELRREKLNGLTDTPDDAFTSTSYDYVRAKIARLGHADRICLVRGYFQETLPHLDATFCMALIDCDLKDSLLYCARTLWPRLVSGGRMLFDDYASMEYQGARHGILEFVEAQAPEIASHGPLDSLYVAVKT